MFVFLTTSDMSNYTGNTLNAKTQKKHYVHLKLHSREQKDVQLGRHATYKFF